MKPLDPIKARYGSVSPSVKDLVRSYASKVADLHETLPYFFRVWEAAHALNAALAKGQLAYEEQAALNKLIEEVPS